MSASRSDGSSAASGSANGSFSGSDVSTVDEVHTIVKEHEDLPDEVIEKIYEDKPELTKGQKRDLTKIFKKYEMPAPFTFTNRRGEVTIYDLAEDMRSIGACDVIVIGDDSGSMNTGKRWQELKEVMKIAVELGCVFDDDGISLQFLNRDGKENVTDISQVENMFGPLPGGYTPIYDKLSEIIENHTGDKILLILLATDGVPTTKDGKKDVKRVKDLIRSRDGTRIFISILACSDNDKEIEWLNELDRDDATCDVIDDYKTEKKQVKKIQGPDFKYSFGMHVARFILGPLYPKYDKLDE
jgi:hypothetical protein